MQIGISIVWVVFAVLFFLLGWSHWKKSKSSIPSFPLPGRAAKSQRNVFVQGLDIDQPITIFINDFNTYINKQNVDSKNSNCRSAIGYWLASLAAFVSLVLEWRSEICQIIRLYPNLSIIKKLESGFVIGFK